MARRRRVPRAPQTKALEPMQWTQATMPWNAWQYAALPQAAEPGSYGPVYACWKIIAEEISRIPLKHIAKNPDGSAITIPTRAPARVFRSPNQYQTRSDFLLYLGRALLSDGNYYGRIVRNDRFEIAQIHPIHPRTCWPHLDMTNGDIYYQVGDPNMQALSRTDDSFWVPARDILHVRLFTPTHPLIGETPLVAAALSVNAGVSINGQVASFFANMARPSGIIRHPKSLAPEAVVRIKERFMEASNGARAGMPVVFTEGMEWTPLTMTAVDAELVASAKLTQSAIAQIYRVPPFMLGDLDQAKFSSVEGLTRWFINSGLGFYLDHISDSLTKAFNLPINEEIVFDYEAALFRSDFKEFMSALEVGTRSGVLAPDEARAKYQLPPVPGGHGKMPRVQQQLVPLSWGGFSEEPKPAPSAPEPAPAPEPPEDPEARAFRVDRMKRRMLGSTPL